MKRITAVNRPFIVTFLASGITYPASSENVQRILDEYPAVTASKFRVVLQGHNTSDPKQRVLIRPSTKGGGPAFIIEKCSKCNGNGCHQCEGD